MALKKFYRIILLQFILIWIYKINKTYVFYKDVLGFALQYITSKLLKLFNSKNFAMLLSFQGQKIYLIVAIHKLNYILKFQQFQKRQIIKQHFICVTSYHRQRLLPPSIFVCLPTDRQTVYLQSGSDRQCHHQNCNKQYYFKYVFTWVSFPY